MKIAFCADVHIGRYTEFNVTTDSRLERCLDAIEQMNVLAIAQGAELIIDAGDLLDKKNQIDFTIYNQVYNFFEAWQATDGLKMWSLVGNHNMALINDPTVNNLVPLNRCIRVIDKAHWLGVIPANRQATPYCLQIAFIPYRRSLDEWWRNYNELLENKPQGDRHILVAHQEIAGAVTGTHRYVATGGLDASRIQGFDWCIFGHYHKHQWLTPNVMYLGALLQQDFGEEGNPQGFWIYDTETNGWTWHGIQTPCFATVEANEPPDNYNFYRLRTRDLSQEKTAELHADTRARVEPIVETTIETRLQVNDPNALDEMISAYLHVNVEPERHDPIREIVKNL